MYTCGLFIIFFNTRLQRKGHECASVTTFLIFFVFYIYCLCIEKAALLSPDDDVQKSDISSSSQGLVEKEALGPMLLEVRCTFFFFLITIYEIFFFFFFYLVPPLRPHI